MPEAAGPQQLYADEIRRNDFVIRRQWTSTITGRSAALSPGITRVTLVIEGDAAVRIGDQESRLHGGLAIWQQQRADIAVESPKPLALMQIETTSVPSGFVTIDQADGVVFEARPAVREMLASQISATLNSEIEPSRPEFPFVQGSIEQAVMALLLGVNEHSTRGRGLYQRAIDVIITRAGDVNLTLDEISGELRISKSQLQRAFRERGTTPLTFLEERRIEFARQLLEDSHAPKPDIDSVARRAGFSSARVMRDALRREASRRRRDA